MSSEKGAYRFEVKRRDHGSPDYAMKPFAAAAWRGRRLVAVQFGRTPGEAFQHAWDVVAKDREREPVEAR